MAAFAENREWKFGLETSLHKQLKLLYACNDQRTEVTLDGFRIDAIAPGGELIEIQHASLSALRDKTRRLLIDTRHKLRIVKPILARKRIITLDKRDGQVVRSRMSPKRGELLDLFLDLVHFSTVFPMRRLTLEFVLIEAAETRIDRKKTKRRGKNYLTIDQTLEQIGQRIVVRKPKELLQLFSAELLPQPFDTSDLALALGRPRWFAQKVAYCFRVMGLAAVAGKRGNSQLYRFRCRLKRCDENAAA